VVRAPIFTQGRNGSPRPRQRTGSACERRVQLDGISARINHEQYFLPVDLNFQGASEALCRHQRNGNRVCRDILGPQNLTVVGEVNPGPKSRQPRTSQKPVGLAEAYAVMTITPSLGVR